MKAKQKRRKFLKISGLTALSIAAGNMSKVYSSVLNNPSTLLNNLKPASNSSAMDINSNELTQSIIGLYGNWAASLNKNRLPTYSFRNNN